MQVDAGDFLHAIFYHLRREKVLVPLFVHGDPTHVLEKNRTNGLGGMSHINRSGIVAHLRKVRQSSTMIEMKMAAKFCGRDNERGRPKQIWVRHEISKAAEERC